MGVISVYDKAGIVDFCRSVSSHYEFISTGKTAEHLEASEISVRSLESVTEYPEILDGRVKTLHPMILGGILGTARQKKELDRLGIHPIGLVVVNLYPFEQVVLKNHNIMDALENIDIGGVTLLRAAAKNFHEVLVVCSPNDYQVVSEAITRNEVSLELRKDLAKKAFQHTAKYDIAISRYFQKDEQFPEDFLLAFDRPQELRYGENWHQPARYYLNPRVMPFYEQLHGKEVSYNNLVDFYAAVGILSESNLPSCAIIKHTSPCGFASAKDIEEAFDDAFATDNLSAFGSAMGFNRKITAGLAEKLNAMFVDAIIAPAYEDETLEILKKKKNVILCRFKDFEIPEYSIRLVPNGVLVQPTDRRILTNEDLTTVTKQKPSPHEVEELLFAWKVVKYAKSNAAVIGKGTKTLGVGMGQSSRIAAVELALKRAGDRAKGAVMASDAFFPYRDSIDSAVSKGIVAIIAPGGSIRDSESVAAADEAGIAMVWSGVRSFLH